MSENKVEMAVFLRTIMSLIDINLRSVSSSCLSCFRAFFLHCDRFFLFLSVIRILKTLLSGVNSV
jgi:hypothetical protein